jgi:CysZ protein
MDFAGRALAFQKNRAFMKHGRVRIEEKGDIVKTTFKPSMFFTGAAAPFSALPFIFSNRGLVAHFIAPFILNIILLASLVALAYCFLPPLVQGILPAGEEWYWAALRWLVTPLVAMLALLVCALVYSITGSIISAPFNDFISARTERLITGAEDSEPFSPARLAGDVLRITGNLLRLMALMILFNILILFLNLVPVAGYALYTALSWGAMFFFLGFQFFDFPLERRRMRFGNKLSVTWRHRFLTAGRGAGFFLITFVPVLGFLALNLAAVGATRLYLAHMNRGQESRR